MLRLSRWTTSGSRTSRTTWSFRWSQGTRSPRKSSNWKSRSFRRSSRKRMSILSSMRSSLTTRRKRRAVCKRVKPSPIQLKSWNWESIRFKPPIWRRKNWWISMWRMRQLLSRHSSRSRRPVASKMLMKSLLLSSRLRSRIMVFSTLLIYWPKRLTLLRTTTSTLMKRLPSTSSWPRKMKLRSKEKSRN